MNLCEILKVKKGLPAENLHSLLFARKLARNPEILPEATVTGYPCILENSAGKPIVNYRIYGNENGVGDLVENGENSGKYEARIACRGKNLFDKNATAETGSIDRNGSIVQTNGWITQILLIKCSDIITIHATNGLGTNANIRCFDYGKNFLGTVLQSTNNALKNTVKLLSETRYIQTCFRENNLDSYQIELGSEATEYAPYCEPVTISIFLEKPLKTGEILKYPENVLVHADGTEENAVLPEIPTFSGTTTIETDTEIQPSNMEITYKKGYCNDK